MNGTAGRPYRTLCYLRSHWLDLIAYAISIAGLGYVIWNLHLPQLRDDLAHVTWWVVAMAILLDICPRLLEAARWDYLLRPLPIGYGHVLQAIYVGTLYSGILPLSAGEIVRAVMVSWRTRVSAVSVLATQLVERVADAVALLLIGWLTFGGLAVPQSLRAALIFLQCLIVLVVVIAFALFARRRNLRARIDAAQPTGKVGNWFRSLALKMRASGVRLTGRATLVAVLTAMATAFVRINVIWLMLSAYHIDFSFLQVAGLYGIITVGTFLPNAPGKVGSWMFFCALGLEVFGIPASQAASFSLIAYVFWTLPPVILGFGALAASPFSWSELRPRRDLMGAEQRSG